MASTTLDVSPDAVRTIEFPENMSTHRISELAKAYILGSLKSPDTAGLYLANKTLLNRIADAGEQGLTPRDVVLQLLRPIFSSKEHCGCTSCRSWCPCCRQLG